MVPNGNPFMTHNGPIYLLHSKPKPRIGKTFSPHSKTELLLYLTASLSPMGEAHQSVEDQCFTVAAALSRHDPHNQPKL